MLGGPQNILSCGATVSKGRPVLLAPTPCHEVAKVDGCGRSVKSRSWYPPMACQEGPTSRPCVVSKECEDVMEQESHQERD